MNESSGIIPRPTPLLRFLNDSAILFKCEDFILNILTEQMFVDAFFEIKCDKLNSRVLCFVEIQLNLLIDRCLNWRRKIC